MTRRTVSFYFGKIKKQSPRNPQKVNISINKTNLTSRLWLLIILWQSNKSLLTIFVLQTYTHTVSLLLFRRKNVCYYLFLFQTKTIEKIKNKINCLHCMNNDFLDI